MSAKYDPDVREAMLRAGVDQILSEMGIIRVEVAEGIRWGTTKDYTDHGLFLVTDESYTNSRAGLNWMKERYRKGDFLIKKHQSGDHFYDFALARPTADGALQVIEGVRACGYGGMGEKISSLSEAHYQALVNGFPVSLQELGLEMYAAPAPALSTLRQEATRIGGVYKIGYSNASLRNANAKLVGTVLEGRIGRGEVLLCFERSAGLNHYVPLSAGDDNVTMPERVVAATPFRIGNLVHTFSRVQTGEIMQKVSFPFYNTEHIDADVRKRMLTPRHSRANGHIFSDLKQ